jgi:hypothetical protein
MNVAKRLERGARQLGRYKRVSNGCCHEDKRTSAGSKHVAAIPGVGLEAQSDVMRDRFASRHWRRDRADRTQRVVDRAARPVVARPR